MRRLLDAAHWLLVRRVASGPRVPLISFPKRRTADGRREHLPSRAVLTAIVMYMHFLLMQLWYRSVWTGLGLEESREGTGGSQQCRCLSIMAVNQSWN